MKRRFPTSAGCTSLTQAALAYAERMHAGQRRADGRPYATHAREVAALLRRAGADEALVAAGALHDVLEKTDVTAAELRSRFGQRVPRLVQSVSDDDAIESWDARKAALRRQVDAAGEESLELYAADKLSKLRELRRATRRDHRPHPREGDPREHRLRHYGRSWSCSRSACRGRRWWTPCNRSSMR